MRKAVLSNEVLQNCPMQLKDRTGHDFTHWYATASLLTAPLFSPEAGVV